MDESDKKAIEDQFLLRERVLVLKKKQQELNKETWRRWGTFFSVLLVFVFCGWVIYIGGNGIGGFGDESTSFIDKYVTHSCERAVSPSTMTNIVAMSKIRNGTNVTHMAPLPANSFAFITPNASTTVALRNDVPGKDCGNSPLPIITLILKGLFIFAGLGIAAYTVNIISKNKNDD